MESCPHQDTCRFEQNFTFRQHLHPDKDDCKDIPVTMCSNDVFGDRVRQRCPAHCGLCTTTTTTSSSTSTSSTTSTSTSSTSSTSTSTSSTTSTSTGTSCSTSTSASTSHCSFHSGGSPFHRTTAEEPCSQRSILTYAASSTTLTIAATRAWLGAIMPFNVIIVFFCTVYIRRCVS